jgi:hypothetical protein
MLQDNLMPAIVHIPLQNKALELSTADKQEKSIGLERKKQNKLAMKQRKTSLKVIKEDPFEESVVFKINMKFKIEYGSVETVEWNGSI